jgi:8-oxo-dGTP pyrophosphatase MutT (NUDIX family)
VEGADTVGAYGITDRRNGMKDVPPEARPVARVLLAGPAQMLLLLHAEDPVGGKRWWVTPGGGLDPGETFEEAARRELREETGMDLSIGRWVWTRRHAYSFMVSGAIGTRGSL